MRTCTTAVAILLLLTEATSAQDGPTMEQVVAAPADYAGQTVTFVGASLSGTITRYDIAGIRKYYLSVSSRNKSFEGGFFLAPPAMADKLYDRMNAKQNYRVNLTCKIARIVLNDVPQWHGFVNRVDFLDGDGQVMDTVKIAK